jgi:hypothetical protein
MTETNTTRLEASIAAAGLGEGAGCAVACGGAEETSQRERAVRRAGPKPAEWRSLRAIRAFSKIDARVACPPRATTAGTMSEPEDVNDFGDAADDAGDGVGDPEDPFGGSDLEPVTDDDEGEEDDDGEDLMENQEMCVARSPSRSRAECRAPATPRGDRATRDAID